MTIPPSNRAKNKNQIDLMTPLKASHNGGCDDERMIALVKFLARCAAIEDYQFYMDAIATPDKMKGGK